MASPSLLSLPKDILVLLPDYLHNIEDYTNLSSTCRALRQCMDTARPNTILRLAAAQSKVFFRPSPHFLVTATARQLGDWARESPSNEAVFAAKMEDGVDGMLDLAMEHCGLTMERIRELYLLRYDVINPVTDIVDKCVGSQWYATPNFWYGGVDDAYTVDSDPPALVFHLAMYGELFGPDLEAYLDTDNTRRRLSVATRLEFVKYCIPEPATLECRGDDCWLPDGREDPRRETKKTGPYAQYSEGEWVNGVAFQNNLALTWTLKSSHWLPHWKAARFTAGCADFQDDFSDGWWYDSDDERSWRQRLWENVMVCQGLQGLEMLRPGKFREKWLGKIREWREKVERMEKEDAVVLVGRQGTHSWPFLMGDLRILMSGYCPGT